MTTTPTSGAADLRATFSEMLVDLPNTEPFTLFKAGFDAALAAGQATAAQVVVPDGITLSAVAAREIHGMLQEVAALIDAMPVSISEQLQVRHFFRDELGGGMLLMEDALAAAAAAAAPAQPAAQQPQQGVAYAELPDLSDAEGEIWSAILDWGHAKRGEDALRKASELERVLVDQLRAFADATCALRASHGQAPAHQVEPSITIDFKQASELLEMFGGDTGLVTLQHGGEKCHSGPGLYAWYSDRPEEGSDFLGAEPDDDAVPAPTAQADTRPDVDTLAEAEYFIDNPSAWSAFDQRASDAIAAVCKALRAAQQHSRG